MIIFFIGSLPYCMGITFKVFLRHQACPPLVYSSSVQLNPLFIRISDPLVLSCSIHPRRLTPSDFLEERLVKARSSMALQTYLMSFSIRAYPHNMEDNLFI
jgi:hypothetical protein